MPVNVKRMLVFLLIILKETGPTTACGDTCTSSTCSCTRLDLRSVPQFLPTTITRLYLYGNAITTLSQSDFSRYSSLTNLQLQQNQISVINRGAFYNLTRLTTLYLTSNQLTSLRADMFVGLDNLQDLWLDYNNIRSIETGTFSTTPRLRDLNLQSNNISNIAPGAFGSLPQLQTLTLNSNRISTFPSDLLSDLNSSRLSYLRLEYNQMETLPPTAYDILAAVSPVYLNNNPWQCDCRMLPFKEKMTGFYTFEYGLTCAGPAHLQGKSLLYDVSPQDLICEEKTSTETFSTPSTSSPVPHSTQHFHSPSSTTTTPSTTHFQPGATEDTFTSSSGSFSFSAFLSGFPGGIIGSLLILNILLAIRCIRRRGKSSSAPAPMSDPSVVYSNIDEATASVSVNVNAAVAAATAPIRDRDRTGHGSSESRAAESSSGRSVLRSPLPSIKGAGPHGDYQNVPAATDAENHYEPLRNHLINQQTCPSALPKGLAGL